MPDTAAEPTEKRVIIHIAGSSINSRGPSGWSAMLQSMDGAKLVKQRQIMGREPDSTNNRMQLTAVLEALKLVKSNNPVIVRTNSQYVVQGARVHLLEWKSKEWRNANGKPI